jgi:hypothetical protein
MSSESACGDPTIFGLPNPNFIGGLGTTISSGTIWNSTLDINLPGDENFKKVIERIEEIEKRLLIVVPKEELYEKYPALKEAYDHYKVIEAIVYNENRKK